MSGASTLKAGDRFSCPGCGRDSIVKTARVMDGWTCVGETLACAFCKAPIAGAAVAAPGSLAAAEAERKSREALSRLSRVLESEPVQQARLTPEEPGRFCRDCMNYLRHPFVSRCLLHDKPVEPMDDCDDFEARPEDAK